MGESEKKEAKKEIAKLQKEIETLSKNAQDQKDMLELIVPIFNEYAKYIGSAETKSEISNLLNAAESSRKGEDISPVTIVEYISNNNTELKKLVKNISESEKNLKTLKKDKNTPKDKIETAEQTVKKHIRHHGTRVTIKTQLEDLDKKIDTAIRLDTQIKTLQSGINKAANKIYNCQNEIISLERILAKPDPVNDKQKPRNFFK